LIAFYFGLTEHGYSLGSKDIPEEVLTYSRTMAFVVIAASQLFYSLSMRNFEKSIIKIGIFSNRYLIGAIAIGLFLQLVVISVPILASAFSVHNLNLRDWAIVIAFALTPLIVNEIIKAVMRPSENR